MYARRYFHVRFPFGIEQESPYVEYKVKRTLHKTSEPQVSLVRRHLLAQPTLTSSIIHQRRTLPSTVPHQAGSSWTLTSALPFSFPEADPLPETNLQEAYKLLYNFDSASRKDAQISRDKIEILKQWAESEEDILPNLTDAQFGLFLHSVYGDVDAAKDCLLTFFRFAIRVPQFFDHWDVSLDKIKQGLECTYYAPLPKLSPRNHAMMYCGYRSSDASKYHFSDGVRLFSMMVEAALLTRGPQEGICVILDMSAMTLSHMWRFPLPLLRKFIEMVQEGLPVRLKEIHITNASYFLPTLLSLVRPFMKKELAEMIQCHSGGMASFYEQFPRDTLPKELGGTLCEAMKYHNDNVKLCAEFAPMWQERENWTNQRRRLKEIKV